MFKIQTLNKISAVGLEEFPRDNYETASGLNDPDAILVRSADMHTMEIPGSLKAVARAGAGVNNIPIDSMTDKGIVVFNTPGANANAVKELVLLSLLISSRPVFEAADWVKTLAGKGKGHPRVGAGKARSARRAFSLFLPRLLSPQGFRLAGAP